jgi:photosystem II stability/assembly factor-like uncharacterized protein
MLNRVIYRLFSCAFIFCIALFSCSHAAQAQWVELSPALIGHGPYNNLGAMASAGGVSWAGMYDLYKSTDQGQTWNSLLWLGGSSANDISFYDDSTGVVSTVGGNGLYLTTNQGRTWQNYFSGDDIFSARFAGSAKIIVVGDASVHQFCFTTDGGATWTERAANIDPKDFYSPASCSVIAFVENYESSYIAATTDYGQTWTNRPGTMEPDAHTFAALPPDGNIIFGINEEGGNYSQDNDLAEIYLSRDGGGSFKSIEQYPLASLAGCALITPAVVYVPTRTNGILESTDTGATWSTASGPSFAIDCRDLVAVNDTLLLLADQQGSIWSAVDTRAKGMSFGSTQATPSQLTLSLSSVQFPDTVSICGQPASVVVYVSSECGGPQIANVSFAGSGIDSNFFSLQSGALDDSIVVLFAPDAARAYSAEIQVATSDGHTITLPVTGAGTNSGTLQLFSSNVVRNDTIGGIVSVPLIMVPGAQWSKLTASLQFDTAMLVYLRTHIPGDPTDFTTAYGTGTAQIQLYGSQVHGDTICLADFLIFPETDSCTTVQFDSISVTYSKGSNCILSNPDVTAQVCAPVGCGTPLLSEYVRYGGIPAIQVVPNPAGGSVSIVSNRDIGSSTISIYDAGGIQRISTTEAVGPEQSPNITLDGLPSGVYFVRIQGAEYSGSLIFLHLR